MKAQKVLLIIQTINMYLMHIPLYIFIICFMTDIGDSGFLNGCLASSLALAVILIHICIANAILSIVSIFKGKESPTKLVMILKLVLIPWYVLNFVMCALVVAGMLNPMLMFGIIPFIAIASTLTYIYMLPTSLPDIGYFIQLKVKKKVAHTPWMIWSMIFMFIFCLDILGSIIFHFSVKKNLNELEEQTQL